MGAVGPTDFAQIAAAARTLFDVPVAVAVTDPGREYQGLDPDEMALVAAARPKRQREFAAGRIGVRRAMVALGMAPMPVLMAPDRAPIWPAGVTGSISHSLTACVAVVGHSDTVSAIGIDLEDDHPLEADLVPLICSRAERAMMARDLDARDLGTLIFSAKEAAYKAQYPITGALFGFETMEIALDLAQGRFTATFSEAVGPFAVGDTLPGRFARAGGHLVSGVAIGQFAHEGA